MGSPPCGGAQSTSGLTLQARKEKMEKKTGQVNLKYVVETEEAEEAKETEESAQRGEADEGAAKEEKMMIEPQKATSAISWIEILILP